MKSYMKNFKNRDDKRGGFGGSRGGRDDRGQRGDDKPVFYGKSRGGDRSTDREQRMFKAVCSDCKKTCEVPFKPSSDKPVFCRDCFSAKRDRETREYKASLLNGESKKFGQDKSTVHSGSTHSTFVPVEAGESTKKQLAEMNARIDKLTLMLEKMIEEKKIVDTHVATSKPTVTKSVKSVVAAVKKVATRPLVVAKKVTPKVVVVKKAEVKKVTVKTIVAKKVAPKAVVAKTATAKKVVTKKVVKAKKGK